eukprot:gene30993-38303_t
MITKMVLENFKSYAGSQEIGPFHKRFSSVVGPNGSGKSNGEVEQIAMMKPKGATASDVGLLEYLEDIIGSNKFIEQIENAQKSLDEKNDLRTANVNRLKIAEKERDNLYGSKKEAEDYMALDSRLRAQKNSLYQVLENVANKNTSLFNERKAKAEEKLSYEQTKAADAEAKLAVFQKKYETDNAEYVAVQSEEQNFTAKYDSFQRKDVKLQEDMKHTKTQIKKHQTIVEKESKKEVDAIEEADSAKLQIEKYSNAVNDFLRKKNEEEAKLDALMETLNGSTAELRTALDLAQGRLAEAEKSVSTQQTEKESTLTAISLLQSRTTENAKRLEQSKDKLAKLLLERETTHNRIVSMEGQGVSALREKIRQLEDGIRELELREVALQGAVRTAMAAAEDARTTLASQQINKGSGHGAVDKIISATKKGGLLSKVAGIRGRLGDLGTINPQYDAAVSTASSSFDCIVVDNNEVAQICVNFLRDHNLGRASFMMTSQMDEWKQKMKRAVQTPADSLRLFDLIQVDDPDISPSFYLALRDTLVVNDLDTAVRIAYVGDRCVWRVVTQDGNLIDTTGTMSGGGKVVKTGSMRLSTSGTKSQKTAASATLNNEEEVTAESVSVLDAQVSALQSQLNECRKSKVSSETELRTARKQLKDASTEVEKGRLQINRLNEQEGELTSRMRELAAQAELTPQESEDVDRQRARLAELESDMMDISPFQKEVAGLQRQIRSVGGPQLVAAQQRVDSMSTQLEKVSSQLSTKQVDESGARKQAEKSAALRVSAEAELLRSEQRLEALVLEQQEMEADAGVVVAALEESRERLAIMEDGLKSISAEFNALKTTVAKVRAVEVDLVVELERIVSDIKESSDVAKRYHKDAAAVRRQHLEEQMEFNAIIRSVAMPPKPASSGASQPVETPSDTPAADESTVDELPVLSPSELEGLDSEAIKRDVNLIEAEKNKLKSSVNMSALLDYLKKDANYKSRLYELELVTEDRNRVRRDYDDLRRQRLEAFMSGFGVISLKLKEMYQMITLGGDAELELLDSLDPFSEGIVFSVRPPKKSWKNISNLSGGEKTLSSLALVFALHHYKPTPLYVMDEIDAALVSYRNNMFELADRLVGIYKTQDATKSVSINPKMFDKATSDSTVAAK